EINQARKTVRNEISKVNAEIIEIEKRLAPDFKVGLEAQLHAKKKELESLDGVKPQIVEDPNESEQAQEESKQAAGKIEQLENQVAAINKEIESLKTTKAVATKKQALAKKIQQSLTNYEGQ